MMPRTHRFSLFFFEISLLGISLLGTSLFWLVVFWPGMSAAQITLDGSLGPAGALTGPDYVIDATLGRQRGGNLFHSFESFNVNTGESATFTGPRNVKNILSRVTGGQSSFIDGMLRSDIPDANLYLLNPSGVLFGENATLDVRGSFTVSTADTVYLGDRGQFNARQPEASLLTSAPPSAFGFLTPNPAGITLSGASLEVQDGQTISIIGGDIRLTGDAAGAVGVNLDAPAGQIHLISVATSGEVGLDPASGDFSLTGFDRLGNIALTDGAVVDVSGEGSGTVFIRGGQLIVENATIAADTFGASDGGGIDIAVTDDLIVSKASFISADTLGAGDGGMITISANRVVLAGGELQQFEDEGELLLFPQISTSSYEASGGKAGDIRISTSRLELRGNANITRFPT